MTPEEKSKYNREWKLRNPDKVRLHQRRSTMKEMYGITPEDYDRMHAEQSGKCKTCKEVPVGDKARGRLHVDHCHQTGKIRGLLCYRCNLAIGHLRDNPALAITVAEYLKEHQHGSG